jgi:hypothetical protein
MMRGPLTAATVVAGLLAIAACGTHDAEPVVEAAAPAAPAPAVGFPDGHPGYVYSGGRPQLIVVTPVKW